MHKVTVNGDKIFEVDGNIVNGSALIADIIRLDDRFFHLLQEGNSYNIEIVKHDSTTKTFTLKINGNLYEVQVKDKFDQLLESMGFGKESINKYSELKAPMPGLVIDIRVAVGAEVKKGDALIVLEAMKMENILKAPADTKVKSIEVKKGDSVEKNHVMIVFE